MLQRHHFPVRARVALDTDAAQRQKDALVAGSADEPFEIGGQRPGGRAGRAAEAAEREARARNVPRIVQSRDQAKGAPELPDFIFVELREWFDHPPLFEELTNLRAAIVMGLDHGGAPAPSSRFDRIRVNCSLPEK